MATASRITPTEALLDSWTRQCKIIDNIVGTLTPELLEAKPSEDGWTIAFHLAHMHGVRGFWHKNASGAEAPVGASLYTATGETWADFIPNTDLKEIRERLKESETLVLDWTAGAIESGQQQSGNYDHPIYYLQHMIWHEGWHVGLDHARASTRRRRAARGMGGQERMGPVAASGVAAHGISESIP